MAAAVRTIPSAHVKRQRGKKNHKHARAAKHKANGKYARQFIRTVKRLGRWRGRKVDRITFTFMFIKEKEE